MLDNECSISPLYGLIGEQGGFSGPVSISFLCHQMTDRKNCSSHSGKILNTHSSKLIFFVSGIAGTTFGGLLVTVLYVLMPNNNPFLHPEHW